MAHPTPLTYFKAAMVLATLTGIEVGVFYVDALEPAFLAIFLLLSITKFVLVVMFYMHLRYDHRLFSSVFVGGLMLAIVVTVAVMSLFQVLSAKTNPPPETEAAGGTVQDGGDGSSGPPTPPDEPTTPSDEPEGISLVATETPGPPLSGEGLFLNVPANVAPQALWCYQCHTIEGIEGATGMIGPDQTHIGTDAATRIPGMSAEEYIRMSITDPEDFVAEGLDRATAGLMTEAITENLTGAQVDALVAFLLEQK